MDNQNQFPIQTPPPKQRRTVRLAEIITVVVFIVALGASGYSYYLLRSDKAVIKQPPTATNQTNNQPTDAKRFVDTETAATIEQAATTEDTTKALKAFFAEYDMTFAVNDLYLSDYVKQYAKITEIGFSDLSGYQAFGKQLVDEWSKYPKSWIKASEVKGIVIAKQISVEGQVRSAMPDVEGDIVYYAIDYPTDYMAAVIHHEFEHLIQYNLFGRYDKPDDKWILCHPQGFAYKGGGILAYDDPEYNDSDHPQRGFVSTYATYAIEEDKAELYSYLMTTHKYPSLKSWAARDTCLGRKVKLYKQFIREHAPEMDDAYFEAIHAL